MTREGAKPAEISDYDLINKFIGGDLQAFEEIYKRHESKVRSICRQMNGLEDYEDRAQMTWKSVFLSLHMFRFDSSFTTWLHRIAVNECLQSLRRNKRETTQDEEFWKSANLPAFLFSPPPTNPHTELENKIEQENTKRFYEEFISELNDQDRLIFVERVNEVEPREIARRLPGRTPTYVSNRFKQVKSKFTEFVCRKSRQGGDSEI